MINRKRKRKKKSSKWRFHQRPSNPNPFTRKSNHNFTSPTNHNRKNPLIFRKYIYVIFKKKTKKKKEKPIYLQIDKQIQIIN